MFLRTFLSLLSFSLLVSAQQPRRDRHVVVISLDGFAAYALNDPTLAVPNLRALVRNGVAAESMKPVNPTVTWPNHTAMVTGNTPARHGVLYNGAPVRAGAGQPMRVEPFVPKVELVHGTTVYDAAHKAGLTTAEVDWVAIQDAPTITWSFAEYGYPDRAVEKEMVAAGLVTAEQVQNFRKLPIQLRDEIWTSAGEYILTKHKPNLLLFHLLTTDSVQHRYGAKSLAAYTALAYADGKVGRLLEATKRAGIYDKTTFIVVSDHGFKTYTKTIALNALLAQKGLDKSAYAISEGGTAMVYVTEPKGKAETVAALKAAFAGVEGVTRVIEPSEFAGLGYPDPAKEPRMCDLVVAAANGYSFSGSAKGEVIGRVPEGSTPGAHGYLHDDPEIQSIFIASGSGIRKGAKLGAIVNLDVAPTIARLLGVALPGTEGKALAILVE